MPDNRELTPAQIAAARMAGIPADRPGLLGEYPKMLFRKRKPGDEAAIHNLATDANGGVSELPIQGEKNIVTLIVDSLDAELQASEEGWVDSVAKAAPKDAAPVSAKKAAA